MTDIAHIKELLEERNALVALDPFHPDLEHADDMLLYAFIFAAPELIAAWEDAERYRWVRDKAINEHAPIVEFPGSEWDAYIDEQLAKERSNGR